MRLNKDNQTNIANSDTVQTPSTVEVQEKTAVVEQIEATDDFAQHSEEYFFGNSAVDELQKNVYSKSIKAVEDIVKIEALATENNISLNTKSAGIESIKSKMKELQGFTFNVGFAGEQSCGKSTIINSLIGFPLMPTCKTATTATVVRMAYSKHWTVIAIDDDESKVVFEYRCEMPTDIGGQKKFLADFNLLKQYCINASKILILENLNYFTDKDVFGQVINPSDLDLNPSNPYHVMFLMLVLFSVYVGQDDSHPTKEKAELMKSRQKLLGNFGIRSNVVNFSVTVKGDFEILKSGMVITDLPGLGSLAEGAVKNGKNVKSHDDITKEAIQSTDAMVFAITPMLQSTGFLAVQELVSTAKVKETTRQSDFIIPLVNQSDRINGELDRDKVYSLFVDGLERVGATKTKDSIFGYSAIYGEHRFKNIPFDRYLFLSNNKDNYQALLSALSMTMPEDAAKATAFSSMKKQLEQKFESSGIIELENYFKSDYIEKGKISKSEELVSQMENSIRALGVEVQKQIDNIKNSIEYEGALNDEIIEKFETALLTPITQRIAKETDNAKKLKKKLKKQTEEKFKKVQQQYADSFDSALSKYKTSLLEICTQFEIPFFSYRAKLSPEGSHNWNLYVELEEKIKKFPFSIIKINKKYVKIIEDISTAVKERYDSALDDLGNLEKGVHDSLDDFLEKSKEDLSSDVYAAVAQTTKTFESYVSEQLKILAQTVVDQQGSESAIKDNIYKWIVEENDKVISKYQSMINDKLEGVKENGFFLWKNNEYLNVEQLKSFINGLDITTEEAASLKKAVEGEITAPIRNIFDKWINESTKVVQNMFFELSDKVKLDINDLKEVIVSSGAEKEKKQKALIQIRENVQTLETNYNNELAEEKKILSKNL